MYGKHFASMYSGSLFGKPAIVFAVWGYVISNMRPSRKDGECYVEINPTLLAATFATDVQQVTDALNTLESPDPASRNSTAEGRRLTLLGEQRHSGPMQYRVVNGATYRAMRDEEERRDYLREAKRSERARKRVNNVNNVNHGQPPSTQAEAEAEADKNLLSDERRTTDRGISKQKRDALFQRCWSLVPRKEGRIDARERFESLVRALPTGPDAEAAFAALGERIERGIRNYRGKIAAEGTEPRYVMQGSRLFRNLDDYVDWQAPVSSKLGTYVPLEVPQ